MFKTHVEHMRNVLQNHNRIEEFVSYVPPRTTGYVYSSAPIITFIKDNTIQDNHCPASFAICCTELHKDLSGLLK